MKGGTCLCVVLCVMGLTAGLSGGADVSPDPTDVRAAVEEETVCPPPLCHSRESGNPEKSLSRPGQSSAGESGRLEEIVEMMTNGDHQAVITVIHDHPDVVHLKDAADWSVLHYAVVQRYGIGEENTDAVALALIARGADVNAATAIAGWTPLHVAAALNRPRVVSALLARGADVNAQTRVGAWTPLAVAEAMAEREANRAERVNGAETVETVALLREAGGQSRDDPAAMPSFIPLAGFHVGNNDFVQGSFTAVGADERLVFEPVGVDPAMDDNNMTAVGLIDKDGRTRVLWSTDWLRSFRELCVDPRTGLHHAIFRQGRRGSGGVPSFLYMHYDADTGTLTEGFEEFVTDGEFEKPGGVKEGQCRWRELQAEHKIVNDLLGVLRATGHAAPSVSGEPVTSEPVTTLLTRVIPSSVVEASLARLRELDHLVAVSDDSDPGEGLDADDEDDPIFLKSLESPRWKIIVVMLKAMYLGDYSYGDGVVLVQDKTRGEWRSVFDCGKIFLTGLRDHTLSFDSEHCYSSYFQYYSMNSVTVDLLTNEVKEGELYYEEALDRRDVWEEKEAAAFARADSAGTAAAYTEYLAAYPQGPHAEEAERQRQAKLKASLEQQMVHVRGGTFRMGCTAEQRDCDDDEKPVHEVQVSDFEIGKYEVTQEVWEAVMGENPSAFLLEDDGDYSQHPVQYVSWNDVQAFLTKLNAVTGAKYRLPTEAEWEYAARGGQRSRGYPYAGSGTLGLVAWHDEKFVDRDPQSRNETHPVGQKQPNELGLYDMSGNVREWVADCWEGGCSTRVVRGGSWFDEPRDLRSANRDWSTAGYKEEDNGFRLARTLTPPRPGAAARKDKPVRQGSEMREHSEHNPEKWEAKP